MRQLLKKNTKWEWTEEIQHDFENLKIDITYTPCLMHFDPNKENFITTDACDSGLGATLRQLDKVNEYRPIAFASRFLNDAEKNTP